MVPFLSCSMLSVIAVYSTWAPGSFSLLSMIPEVMPWAACPQARSMICSVTIEPCATRKAPASYPDFLEVAWRYTLVYFVRFLSIFDTFGTTVRLAVPGLAIDQGACPDCLQPQIRGLRQEVHL